MQLCTVLHITTVMEQAVILHGIKMLLRSKPKFAYSGLTIIMSNPSRFDTHRLLSANGGQMFDAYCLRPEMNAMQCDVRVMEDNSPFLEGTKCLLLLGQSAMHKYCPETIGNILNELRGGLYYHKGIPCIASYLPQECVDFKNYEQQNNPLAKDYTADDSVSDDDEEEGDVKALGRTKRSNYAFWLRRDVWKCKQILQGRRGDNTSIQPAYRLYPTADIVINILRSTKNQVLFFDIETDYEEQNLQCFSFNFSDSNIVYCVPILDHNYFFAYTAVPLILRALAVAIRDNLLVAHNGSSFDFFILAYKYRIPINRTYDTMIAMHRCFPDVEKSLGHCVSYWTWEKFHKDTDSHGYMTRAQVNQRMTYCGKDVWTMRLVYEAIESYAKTIPGLKKSIDDAMRCIRPYLISTLYGIKVDDDKRAKLVTENDRLMMQYNRMIELLVGPQGMKDVNSITKSKGLIAGSNIKLCEYFHEQLGYKIMMRSSKTGKPSLGKKALYKLALAYDNPVIPLVCAYRSVVKETGRFLFEPWTFYDNNSTQPASTPEAIVH